MNIKSSLAIEAKYNRTINLIFSGAFVKVYNRSFYLLTEIVGRKLKAQTGYIKSVDNQFVVSGGFPAERVQEQYPQAKKTGWGYQLIIDEFDRSDYLTWRLQQELAAQAVGDEAEAMLTPCPEEFGQGSFTATQLQVAQKNIPLTLVLTEQQLAYLQNWQKGNYPIEVDLGFIESLKLQLHNIQI